MKCEKCGTELATGAAFCHACGAPAGGPLAAAPPPMPSPKDRLSPASRGADDREELLWEGSFSKLAMIGAWISAGLFTIVLVVVAVAASFSRTAWLITICVIAVVWIGLLLRLLYLQLSIKYSLTTQRLVHEHGLLWRKTDRIETIDIDDVTIDQGPVERMLGVGTVRLMSSDQSTPEFHVVGIEDVRRVATLIDEARRQERRKRGLHIETV